MKKENKQIIFFYQFSLGLLNIYLFNRLTYQISSFIATYTNTYYPFVNNLYLLLITLSIFLNFSNFANIISTIGSNKNEEILLKEFKKISQNIMYIFLMSFIIQILPHFITRTN